MTRNPKKQEIFKKF